MSFDFKSIKDFDTHIKLSIPNYDGLMDVFIALSLENTHTGGAVLDIGCSTGNLLNSLPKVENVKYIGCDIVDICDTKNFTFINDDCHTVLAGIDHADVIFSVFTLQFLGRHKRVAVVDEIKRLVSGGAVALIAEKTYCNNVQVNTVLWREHIRQKRMVFSDKDILDKDYALFGSMHPKKSSFLQKELDYIGEAEQVWQSYNFKGFIVS